MGIWHSVLMANLFLAVMRFLSNSAISRRMKWSHVALELGVIFGRSRGFGPFYLHSVSNDRQAKQAEGFNSIRLPNATDRPSHRVLSRSTLRQNADRTLRQNSDQVEISKKFIAISAPTPTLGPRVFYDRDVGLQ